MLRRESVERRYFISMANTKKKTTGKKTAAKKKTTKKNTGKKVQKKNRIPVYIISLCLITILLAVLMYIDNGEGGILNTAVKNACCGLFGVCGYFVPLLSAGLTAYMIKEKDEKKFWIKTVLGFLALINVSAIVNLFTPETSYSVSDAFVFGYTVPAGGGFFGGCVSIFLNNMVQKVASCIILVFTLIIIASFLTNVQIFAVVFGYIRDAIADARIRKEERDMYYDEYEDDYADEYGVYPPHSGDIGAEKKKKPKSKKKKADTEKQAHDSLKEDAYSSGIDEIFGDTEYPIPQSKKNKAAKAADEAPAEPLDEPETDVQPEKADEKPEKAEKISEKEKEQYNKEFNDAIEQQKIEYVAPPIKLLNLPKAISGDKREEMRRTASKLISVLEDFGVKAKLVQVTQGPTVTRYEIQPETGTKLAKIAGLADDIALNLAVSTVLVAPVPGKAAVGIEIPNNKVSSVSVRELLESDEFKNAKSKLTIALGKDIGGNVVIGDIAKMPHVLIAGATGSGKSVCINSIIMSLLYKAKPDEVKLIMVDPKVVELGVYNGIPHLLVPVVTDPKKAAGALNWAVTEMMRRYELFKETGVRKLESYNKLMESNGGDKIPQLVIIIDELADLMMVASKEVEDYIVRLTQLARAAGIHLIIATQRPSVDVITGLIKANIPSRIAFAVSSQIDSRTILDKGGAEKLLGMGDMLYHPSGARVATRVQGAFVSDAEIEKVLEFIKENVGETHYSEDLAEEIERHATGENGVTPDVEEDGDPLLKEAISLALDLGKISTSMVQRRLGVGYARAGRIIDQMEARGIISGANGAKPRDVLVSHADLTMDDGGTDDEDEEYDDEQ